MQLIDEEQQAINSGYQRSTRAPHLEPCVGRRVWSWGLLFYICFLTFRLCPVSWGTWRQWMYQLWHHYQVPPKHQDCPCVRVGPCQQDPPSRSGLFQTVDDPITPEDSLQHMPCHCLLGRPQSFYTCSPDSAHDRFCDVQLWSIHGDALWHLLLRALLVPYSEVNTACPLSSFLGRSVREGRTSIVGSPAVVGG
jgi:hypothetical protein